MLLEGPRMSDPKDEVKKENFVTMGWDQDGMGTLTGETVEKAAITTFILAFY